MPATRILLVEDDEVLADTVAEWLREDGHRVLAARSGAEGLARAREGIDVVLLDYKLPDVDGFEVLRRLHREHPRTPVVMLTGHASVDHAVEAMKRGAFHYLPKPTPLEEIGRVIRQAEMVALARRDRSDTSSAGPTEDIVGDAPAMVQLRSMIRRLGASSRAAVLITGESGTGKDLAAQALHAAGPHASGPFIAVNCSALPENLLESELFGHERGAFTDAKARHRGLFERAQQGTIFLDEIGDMDPALQAKLLRVLEQKRFRRVGGTEDLVADVRVVAATNVDLLGAAKAGRFRLDLYYRLAVLVVHMPPLRERGGDVELLANRFVEQLCRDVDRPPCHLDAAALRTLVAHDWPGNVRELRNVIERAVILTEGHTIGAEDLELAGPMPSPSSSFALPAGGVNMRAVEKELLMQALERTGGNATAAAKLLGLNRDQVRYRVQKLGLSEVGEKGDDLGLPA